MFWLILGFTWLTSVALILSCLGVVRERENESLAGASLQSAWPPSLRISDGTMSLGAPIRPTRRVA